VNFPGFADSELYFYPIIFYVRAERNEGIFFFGSAREILYLIFVARAFGQEKKSSRRSSK